MKVNVETSNSAAFGSQESCLVVPVFSGAFPVMSDLLAEEDESTIQALADKEAISGKAGECYYIPTPNGAYKGILVAGLGTAKAFDAEVLRRVGGSAVTHFGKNRVVDVYFDATGDGALPVAAFLEGVVLGQYDFRVYKEETERAPAPKVDSLTVVVKEGVAVESVKEECSLAVLVCLSTNGARHLANTASNEMTPRALADFAQGIADESGCACDILEPKQLASLGMNALLGVAQGSAEPARLIMLRHHHSDDAKTLAMVGKGITFDTGGISIKPADAMHEMKYDMCGAAAVLCAMMTIVELKPAINVICVVPAAENMTGEAAMRPGDIVKAYNGKTIEVHNTDAEGRLVLADAMAFVADKYRPDAMVDLATLTGACVVALGHYAAGLMGTDEALLGALQRAGEDTGERLWQLPLWEVYDKLIEGTHADLCNIGPRGEAGAITAASFLKHFVGDVPWAHVDIAGTAWGGKHVPYWDANHATGFGVRFLTRWILDAAAAQDGDA